jgi:polyisoprenoid-binding protein YceI
MKKPFHTALIAIIISGCALRAHSQEYVVDASHDRMGFNFTAANPLALPKLA